MNHLDHGHHGGRRIWALAAAAALALHLGGAAFALSNFRDEGYDDGLGADAEVIDIEMGSPKVDENDLPKGVDSFAQAASVATPEQKAEVEQSDMQKDAPTTTEEADRQVTTADVKKPTEEEKVAAVQTHASDAAEASEDSSRKSLDEKVPEADKAKAPNIGIGRDKSVETKKWEAKLSRYFELHKKYPPGKKAGASVRVQLTLNRRGNVVAVNVSESSGDPDYDREAVAMVRRSDPVPKPPASATEDEFVFNLPVNFNAAK